MLSKLANTAAREELTGLEFAAGIPGTVGGAVMMNAGAYGSEMKNVLLWADVMDQDGNVKLMKNEELELGYRTSCLERLGLFTVRAAFKLTPGDPGGDPVADGRAGKKEKREAAVRIPERRKHLQAPGRIFRRKN